jgi:hypothetical protein
MAYVFAIHCIAFLSPLIKDHEEPMWLNLKQHQQYLIGLLQWSAKVKHIKELDLQIRQHQADFLKIWQYKPLYRYKLHAILHAAYNWLYVGPLRASWCLKGNKQRHIPTVT